MLVFIAPLRHPATVPSMRRAEELLSLTAGSLLNQSRPDWRLIVVCNAVPDQRVEDPRIHYHVVPFPPAEQSRKHGEAGTPRTIRIDKGVKTLSGALLARKWGATHFMPIDCDDWFHRGLVAAALEETDAGATYVDRGYVVNFAARTYRRRYGLVRYCGSTYVYGASLFFRLAHLGRQVDEYSGAAELIASTSEDFVADVAGDHHAGFPATRRLGVEPRALPIPAVCWVVANGENVSREMSQDAGIPMDRGFCERFGVPADLAIDPRFAADQRIKDLVAAQRSRLTWAISRWTGTWRF